MPELPKIFDRIIWRTGLLVDFFWNDGEFAYCATYRADLGVRTGWYAMPV